MNRRRTAALALLAGVMAAAPARSTFMFPQLILLRPQGSSTVIVIGHTGDGQNIRNDTLAVLYSGLTPVYPSAPATVRHRPAVDVGEFFDARAWRYYDADRRITRPPPFDSATHHSRIYQAAGGDPPIWEDPVVAPGGVHDTFYAVDARAEELLLARGIRLRSQSGVP